MLNVPGLKKNLQAAALLVLVLSRPAIAGKELTAAREAAALGSEARALDIAMRGLKQAPQDRELFLYALELLPETGSRHAAALAALAREKLEKESGDYAWHLGVCKTVRVAGNAGKAAASCRRALELEPIVYATYREMGLTLAATGNPVKAAEVFERGTGIAPSDYRAHYHLAKALENSGNIPGAHKAYGTALELAGQTRSLDARYHTALISAGLKRLGRKMPEPRAPAPEPPAKANRYSKCLEKFRGEVRKDNLLSAVEISAACRKLVPDEPQLAAELAPLLVRLGQYEQGVKEYERAALLNSATKTTAALLHAKAAETWLKLDDLANAVSQYRLAVTANPADAKSLQGLAGALETRSDLKGALEAYAGILKLEPSNNHARTRLEEIKTDLMTTAQIMEELRLRRAIEENRLSPQPDDIALFKAIRAAETSGGVDYVRGKVHSSKGLYLERATPEGTKVVLTNAGYTTYLFHATRDAISFFERQQIGLREIFKLRDSMGEPLFDAAGRLTPEGLAAWRKGLSGTKTWLLPYEAVAASPKAVQANKDMAEAQKKGYREISEPEYLWLLRATECPEDVMTGKILLMRVINDGARVRYMICSVTNAACMNPLNATLPAAIENYRDGKTDLSSSGFFGTGAVKKHRVCVDGRVWGAE
ncbi:MAG: hypothetical protein A2234_08615 [Elusimicrobia bacterium RIFOXYA2_FULL_58_8]|nr:MAG: hypothetical protein A2234_08615 [Elusimicrobia bacterium RIFOXYA2_FULL_58_8]